MPVINNLSASNSSFVLQYGAYSDFNLFILMVSFAIILTIISRFISSREETGRFLLSVLAVIFAVSGIWMSLGLAHLDFTPGASVINGSITYNYVFATQQVIASPALTIICIILTIFTFINALDIFLSIIQKAPENGSFKLRKKGKEDYAIDGKMVRIREEK